MLRYTRQKYLSKNNNFVNVRFHPGTITEDIVDFIKPVIRKKPDAVIIHAETNDLTNGTNTMKQVHKTLKKTTLWPLFMDGVQLPQGYSHFEEAVYFLPFSSQKFLVLILSTSEG